MGLFINKSQFPFVFGNQGSLNGSNQDYFKLDHFQELLKKQHMLNKSMHQSFLTLTGQLNEQKKMQQKNWQGLTEELDALQKSSRQQQIFESQAMEWFTMLDETNRKLGEMVEKDEHKQQEILDEMKLITETNQAISAKMAEHDSAQKSLPEQLQSLMVLQEQMHEQISLQDQNQDVVIDKLDNQSALMEKTLRQVNNIRSSIFERASYIAEKVEDSYALTSSFVYKLMTGSKQPLSFFMSNDGMKSESQTKD